MDGRRSITLHVKLISNELNYKGWVQTLFTIFRGK